MNCLKILLFLCFLFTEEVYSLNCTLSGGPLQCNKELCPPDSQIIIALPDTVYTCDKPLNLSAPILQIQGNYSSLNLNGTNVTINGIYASQNLHILHEQTLLIQGNIKVDNLLIIDVIATSQQNANSSSLTVSSALITAQKIVLQTYGQIQFTNSTLSTFGTVCLYHSIHLQDFSISIWQNQFIADFNDLFKTGVSVAILTFGNIRISESKLQTSILAMITQNNITISYSSIDTSAKSCRTNMGEGRGLIVQVQNEFCSSGSAGAGYGLNSGQNCSSILQYFMFLTHSFPYMKKGPKIATGSGGYGYNNFRNSQKGAGGGIIYIFAKSEITLQAANLSSSGGDVLYDDPLSAGSGGVIYIYSDTLSGNQSNISTYGGSSFNNKGAGSGGMVKISYQHLNKEKHGLLWINTSQGYQPSHPEIDLQANGIFYGPLCPAGRVRWYLGCQTCPKNTYNMISNQFCLKCPKSNDFQWDLNLQGMKNPWDCYQSNAHGPYYIWIVPGQIDIISITCYIGLLIVFVIIGVVIRRQIKKIKEKNEETQFDLQGLKKEIREEKILTQKLKKQKSIKMYELMYHMHRITVAGSNTYLCPWVLPLIPPESIKKYILLSAYENFARKFNKLSQWTRSEEFLIKLLYLIYPLHWFYYDTVKKRKYRRLCKLLEEFREYNLINNYQFQDKDLITLKFSKNKDYTSCYIDFFFYEKADLSYFNLSIPFIIYLSGQGNFIRPFYIEENDPFVKAMNFIVNRNTYNNQKQQGIYNNPVRQFFEDKQKLLRNLVNLNLRKKNHHQLKKFIINFNAISCTLDLSAPINIFIKTLSILIEFLNVWNKKFFNKVKVQIDLILMISDLHQQNIVSSSIHILSNKNQEFLQKVKSIIPRMNLNNQIDLKIGLFIYNPEQEISSKKDPNQPLGMIRNSILSAEYGHSEQDQDQNQLGQTLLFEQSKLKGNHKESFKSKLTRYLCLFRYFMLSHQITDKDRYTIKLQQSFLILTQTVLVFVWSIKIQIPYIFINLISPFIGIIWIVSDSYGFGKLFLIFNAMNLLNQLATLLIYSLAEDQDTGSLIKIATCQSINLILVIFNMFIGSRSITFSKKLKNVE